MEVIALILVLMSPIVFMVWSLPAMPGHCSICKYGKSGNQSNTICDGCHVAIWSDIT